MDKLIQTSLFQNKSFRLPGIGTLSVITNSAETDYINLAIKSPVHTIIFTEDQQEANLFNKFSSTSEFLKTKLEETGTFHLDGVGTFTKRDGKIRFLGVALSRELIQPVKAERVSKQTSTQRKVVVKETTVAEKTNYIIEETVVVTKKKSYWGIWAIGLGIAALVLLGFYFYLNPPSILSFGNTNTIQAAPASPASHHEIK